MFKICELWPCDMNSTLGSVVPLAMICSTGISGWLYFWTPSQYFAWQSFDVVEGWLWLGQALSKPWPYQRGGSSDPCQVFQWFLLSDIGPKWDLTAHPEYFLIRLWAFQGKPSNKICGVAQVVLHNTRRHFLTFRIFICGIEIAGHDNDGEKQREEAKLPFAKYV